MTDTVSINREHFYQLLSAQIVLSVYKKSFLKLKKCDFESASDDNNQQKINNILEVGNKSQTPIQSGENK